MTFFIALFIGYFIGGLHGSNLVGYIKKIDIKNEGVKNAGASNTAILLGWKYGALVAFIDIAKAPLSMILFYLVSDYFHLSPESYLPFTILAFVIIGHNYPITMNFKGGKGTASFIGGLFFLDWNIALVSFLILLALTFVSDYLVVGVIGLYLSSILLFYLLGYHPIGIFIIFILFLLSTYKHRENYKRIANNQETKISTFISKKRK